MVKKLSDPFWAQMTGFSTNQQCDLYPGGSYQRVQHDENGRLCTHNGSDTIPSEYPSIKVDKPVDTKDCSACENTFDKTWPFLMHNNSAVCIRCYERFNFVDRDTLRSHIRGMILAQFSDIHPDKQYVEALKQEQRIEFEMIINKNANI